MKYYSEEQTKDLGRVFEEAVLRLPEVSTKRMFGCPCYTAKNRVFVFFVTKGIVITQLTQAERVKLLVQERTTAFRAGKKTVRNWMRVPLTGERDLTGIMPYVLRSYESVFAKAEKSQG